MRRPEPARVQHLGGDVFCEPFGQVWNITICSVCKATELADVSSERGVNEFEAVFGEPLVLRRQL